MKKLKLMAQALWKQRKPKQETILKFEIMKCCIVGLCGEIICAVAIIAMLVEILFENKKGGFA